MTGITATPVTVLMPVRNGQAWIRDSMMSLLKQDYENFQVLLIDDASNDDSVNIAVDLGKDKVRVLRSNGQGVSKALALGVHASDTEIIARMDVDDLAHQSRLTSQVAFLNQNPDYVLIGSNVNLINEAGQTTGKSHFPLTDQAIRKRMAITNPFAHPSVMYRRSSVLAAGNYYSPSSEPFPEDYHLWSRLLQIGKVTNLKERLVNYRVNSKGVSQVNAAEMRAASARISWGWLQGLRPTTKNEDALKSAWYACYGEPSRISLRQAALVTCELFRLELPTFNAAGKRGLRLRHYAIPSAKMLR